jgi:hypothetical protein
LNPNNILVIGDLHAPFIKSGYFEFCLEQQQAFDCGTVIFIGDIADFHSSSFHQSESQAYGPDIELSLAHAELEKWYEAFPVARITYGNHDLIPYRKGFAGGLAQRTMRTWRDLFNAPRGWTFAEKFIIDDVLYTHGINAALARMTQARISVVQGHLHSQQYVQWSQSEVDRLFAMQVGCGIDADNWAFNYGKGFAKKPIMGCGVVLDRGRVPIVLPYHIKETKKRK